MICQLKACLVSRFLDKRNLLSLAKTRRARQLTRDLFVARERCVHAGVRVHNRFGVAGRPAAQREQP